MTGKQLPHNIKGAIMNINKKIDELNTEIHDRKVLLFHEERALMFGQAMYGPRTSVERIIKWEKELKDLNRRVRVLMTIENVSNKMFHN